MRTHVRVPERGEFSVQIGTGQQERPEIYIGLVGATGTDLDLVYAGIERALANFDYDVEPVRLSDLLKLPYPDLPDRDKVPFDDYVMKYQDAGDEFRKTFKRGDALALVAMIDISRVRGTLTGDRNLPQQDMAFVLRSFKNPAEVDALRRIYGNRFVLFAAYQPRDARVNDTTERIRQSDPDRKEDNYRSQAELVIARDEKLGHPIFGQNVRDTFPNADFFVDARDGLLGESIQRCLDLFFGSYYTTPSRDEYAMFHAEAAKVRSAELGRQVGAVIATGEGVVVAVGTNEVPKAGGGLYWEGDSGDMRDFRKGEDSNQRGKHLAVHELLERLRKGWLAPERREATVADLLGLLDDTRIDNIIEFGRAAHAEEAALTDAASRGVSIHGCTLYSTTFPCHLCARRIVAAGINRVVYIHPYPKSLAAELHSDSLSIDVEHPPAGRVHFEPFVGVSPTRYLQLFTAPLRRKTDDGKTLPFHRPSAVPKLVVPEPGEVQPVYLARERAAVGEFVEQAEASELAAELQTLIEEVKLDGERESGSSPGSSPAGNG